MTKGTGYEIFDREKLLGYIQELPPQYKLKQIDREIYRECLENEWSRDLVACFPSREKFERLGLGMVVAENNHIVSGAALILECLDKRCYCRLIKADL